MPGTLDPFTAEECISTGEAAALARRAERTIRVWCTEYGIGRHIADGPWAVSRVALQMLLDGNKKALAEYHGGARRSSELVVKYYYRCGLAHLLERPEFST